MFTQYVLEYGVGELEPHIDELTMVTHYTKHHGAYTNNLNAAVEKVPEISNWSIEKLLANLESIEDDTIRTAIRNNGGGFYNHNLYFSILSPEGKHAPDGPLAERIAKDFGTFEQLKDTKTASAMGRFGSGWAWLVVKHDKVLDIVSTPNQDNPLMDNSGAKPILGIDVWEHAYYLKYKNLRGDYIKAFWNVVDWNKVSNLYVRATT